MISSSIKTMSLLALSFALTFILTIFVFESEAPALKPKFAKIFDRTVSVVVGSKGEPVQPGVDPTPPPSIYY